MFRSFQTKLALFFMALFAVVLSIAFVATYNAIVSNVFAQNRDQLKSSYDIFTRRMASNAATLAEGSSILASDFAFRSAVATNENPTIISALVNHQARIKADRVMLVSLDNQIMADTGAVSETSQAGIGSLGMDKADFPFPDIIEDADIDGRANSVAVVDGRIYQLVAVPILAPVAIAWIVVCIEIDDEFAADIQHQFAVDREITFGVRYGTGQWQPVASTLSPELRPALSRGIAAASESSLMEPTTVQMNGSDYVTLIAPLPTPQASPPIRAILQYSLDLALAPYQGLFVLLLGLAGGALTLSLVGAVFVSRGVSKPIRVLDEAARRIKAGRYDEKVPVAQQDEIGRLSETFNQMMQGIAEREEKIAYQARHDSLTGLPNRLAFEGHIADLIIARQDAKKVFSVLLLQIGRFSEINNTLGHDTGEQLFRKIGRSLQNIVPHPNAIARHANNMFAVVLDMQDATEVNMTIERIMAIFEVPVSIAGLNIDVTATIGEANYPRHGNAARPLLQHADTAIYEAQKQGRSYAIYDPELDPHKPERLSMMGELRQGLDKGQFKFFFQPKVNIATQTVTAVEALIRWVHPERGFMAPDQFIPMAEQTGNIQKLTAWAMEAAIKQARVWGERDIDVKIGVNLSARDLTNRRLPDQIGRLLALHNVSSRHLILEITESAVMEDPTNALEVLTALNGMGLTLSIDDYGIGYSSLAYLKRLPVQEIKIDKSFVLKLASNKGDEILVRSTIDLGHNLGLKVTAEGIEDPQSFEILRNYGCDTAQGYLISKPIPAEEFEKFYRTSAWSPVGRGQARAVAAGE